MMISVITPTYNSSATITGTAHSVLFQSYQNFEHIIIDKASDDDTTDKIINLYKSTGKIEKLKILSEPDNGIADAFNKGIKLAGGELITILNSDDKYFDEKVFQRVINGLSKNRNALFVHGNILFVDEKYGTNIRKPLMCDLTYAMPFNHPTMFIKKSVYDKVGLYNTKYKYAMDFELICRLTLSMDNFFSKGVYLDGDPLVVMSAGGASWKAEKETLIEWKRALIQYKFWNKEARKNYLLRRIRIIMKSILSKFHIEGVVKIWRKRKWKSF